MPKRILGALLSVLLPGARYGVAATLGEFSSEDGKVKALLSVPDGEPDPGRGLVTSLVVRFGHEAAAETTAPVDGASAPVGPPAPPLKASDLTFAAMMPETGYRMPLQPMIEQTSPDEFVIRGVKLTVPGQWELAIEARVADLPVRVRVPMKR